MLAVNLQNSAEYVCTGFDHAEAVEGYIKGYRRVFWQGSTGGVLYYTTFRDAAGHLAVLSRVCDTHSSESPLTGPSMRTPVPACVLQTTVAHQKHQAGQSHCSQTKKQSR